ALMPAEEFGQEHIPGSVALDWPALEITDTSDASVVRWQTEMAELFASLGVVPGRRVVTYDGGSLFATRPWWVLHYLGHDTVAVLDGGLPGWQSAGGAIVTGMAATPDASPPASRIATAFERQPRSNALATLAEVQASLADSGVVFVDARTPEEYVAGHIPGAININYPRNARPEPPHVWLPPDELRAMYESAGVTPDKRVIPYCTTGVRSSVTFFTLHLLGYDNVSLFTGSWAEWSSHPELPVTTGNRP
ncbi:MAG: sulfurtransferase, partial [Chloroflexota bacterium]|nr:sulfurtransferase [Chloroflexota bacterium]